ncbi:RNA polymerase sigma factor [Flagellimonas onchidii]|uniref:RNA polymerase sigma factor n=1 Tax=Flagellimonas onchidii TaxID=2562684 RepID=UPI0010A5D7F2|nr:RNA polymerase sigma factor [Allomuricauda onchidii]
MNKNERSVDGQLVTSFQSGDKQALVALVKRWHKTFCDRAYWLLKDPDMAKDVAQDCWQIIIDKMDTLQEPKNFGAWAMRIVYTKSIDAVKAKNRMTTIQNQLENEKHDTEADEPSARDNLKRDLLQMVNKLPERQQMVIRLFYVQEYSLREISGMLGISTGTAKSRLFHAREKLKTILKNRIYEN